MCACVRQFVCVCVCVCDCVFVRTSIVPLGQFVCIIIYYAKSCVKIAVASFLLRPDLSPPYLPSLPCIADEVSQQILHMCMYVYVCAKPANVSIHQTVTAVRPAPEGRMRESQTKMGRHEHG